jgi:hypothetical protein
MLIAEALPESRGTILKRCFGEENSRLHPAAAVRGSAIRDRIHD